MMSWIDRIVAPFVLFCLLLPASALAGAAGSDFEMLVEGLAPEQAIRAGEKMYRAGMLPSGKPLNATVQKSVTISGEQANCSRCHLRSGLGTVTGDVLIPPISGARLYQPIKNSNDIPGPFSNRAMFAYPRPAYNDVTLAKAIRKGVDSGGRPLNASMPRYVMDNKEMAIMTNYLKRLSSVPSPGVSDNEIRFATIVSDKLTQKEKDALLQPLETFVREEWNGRHASRQAKWNRGGGDKPAGPKYRQVVLDTWVLKGNPEEWRKQLDAYYAEKPVFAILGGVVRGKWEPIHNFCEENRIPCILPVTDQPVVSPSDWYTLYLSKGYFQEGEVAATFLSKVVAAPGHSRVVQVFRETGNGSAISAGFAEAWKRLGGGPITRRIVAPSEKTGKAFWKRLAADHPGSVLLVWLSAQDMVEIETVMDSGANPSKLFFSSTMLTGAWNVIPDKLRDISFLTYPTRLPEDMRYSSSVFSNWMKMKHLLIHDTAISSRVYLLTRLLSFALVDMGADCYRDYFLDILDRGKDPSTASVDYPFLRFEPGRRYASGGCYVVTLTKGSGPAKIKRSEWIWL